MQNSSLSIHLESYPPGKNVYVHVSNMYVQPMYNAIVHPYYVHGSYMYILFWKCMYMYIHFQKCMNMYVQCMYMVRTCLYISRYKHVCTSFRRVCTCFDIYKHILLFTNTYTGIPCLNLYIPVCTADVRATYITWNVCTPYVHPSTVYIHRYFLLVSAFWIALLAGL